MTTRGRRPWRVRAIALPLLCLLGTSCNDLPTAFEPLPPTRLAIIGGNCIQSTSLRVIEGRKCEIEAEARDANNQVVVVGFTWTTGDPTIATVSLKPGFDSVVAVVSGVTVGKTTVRVEVSGRPELSSERDLFVLNSNNPDL